MSRIFDTNFKDYVENVKNLGIPLKFIGIDHWGNEFMMIRESEILKFFIKEENEFVLKKVLDIKTGSEINIEVFYG